MWFGFVLRVPLTDAPQASRWFSSACVGLICYDWHPWRGGDKNDDNKSDAIYSLIDNVWIKKPKYRELPYINRKKIDLYISSFVNAIDNLSNIEDPLTKYHEAIKLKNRIKQIRQSGLSSSKGNFSEENLVFKTLRATNKIKKLREEMVDSMEQILSIIEPKENK